MTRAAAGPTCQRPGCGEVLSWRMREGTKFCSTRCRVAEHRRRGRTRAGGVTRTELVLAEWLRLVEACAQAVAAGRSHVETVAALRAQTRRVIAEHQRIGAPIPPQVMRLHAALVGSQVEQGVPSTSPGVGRGSGAGAALRTPAARVHGVVDDGGPAAGEGARSGAPVLPVDGLPGV